MAKRLTGQFPHLRPAEPKFFLMGVAAMLEQYPQGLVMECMEPGVGYASKAEYFSLKTLNDWFSSRLSYHQAMASYKTLALVRRSA